MKGNKFPCTGLVDTKGFGAFLEQELGAPRKNLKLFTEALKTILGVERASLVNSGSSANLVAAIAVRELVPGRNKVLLSGFSFPTTISSFALLGFEVELIDVEPNNFNMSVTALEERIDHQVACVCVTHFLGYPARLAAIKQLCEHHGAILVQDACETMALQSDGLPVYDYGDIVTHSFYHPHHLSTYGGGAVIGKNDALQQQIESIIHWGRACTCHYDPTICQAPHGQNHNFWYERLGINVEMSELNACFGRFQLQSWPQQEQTRNQYYNLYFEKLNNLPEVSVYANNANVSPFVFPIMVHKSKKEAISAELFQQGVETRSIMGGAIFKHPAFLHLQHADLVNAEAVSDACFFVGVHQTLSAGQVNDASDIVYNVLKHST